ncbi:L-glutamate gamma-semialdehyde dehydrogenase [Aneurinibacillus migulanus]|uniref:L-glutamate gamma-semialdehyde dehydrogenase n=2 Tax=Aneurinibacillus migulanus TaxID=47500 RepID=UPI0005B95FE7|nr:L-glutamate gamma-semialdehyde dehydrogenase [Aneurinibacillus migulanus]KIV51686.1 1-pyrroline-5-carboxylate dehydrogenase [Aneurinibacillus migulanus]KIV60049.1 1-pyrroline-5-carboxylate dehydrogenase [Aneurinibacillus migulanus]MCP1354727.1 L-glutamate gamma-semialdehyde dehydrogenase [Aneurinibacillus migulanus]CEH27762.1 Putative delta-1-pyrroline-5-carboxylate dehydrog enase [Aneurinibacillus migulanus]CEH31322.1 Putative delta-1-pyrroline-5-carboxylate dehydrog enase [Aneurinibacillu
MIPYRPEPFTNFAEEKNMNAINEALEKVSAELGRDYPLVIGGEEVMTEERLVSVNPSAKKEVVGSVSSADQALADKAMHNAAATFKTWSRIPVEHRAGYLFKASAMMRRRKHEFSAWLMLEAGKSRAEADADTAEAIDFMEYYARQALELKDRGQQTLVRLPGEDNHLEYIPLGVGVVIPPWNFALAIVVGMVTSAMVTGNTVILKPASQTPVIAYKFYELLVEAGLPAGVVNFLPGRPDVIGDYLVDHKLTRFISFTGSRAVGLRIHERSSKVAPGQIWMKRLVAEMGGKDAIVVLDDADVELAAQNIVASAFSFSGQKCSACSRAIIHEAVYDEVLNRVVDITKGLKVGDVRDASNYTGPVIDEKALNKVMEYVEIGKREGRLVAGGKPAGDEGFFVEPTIFADVDPDARIMQEEVFGPFVAFTKVRDFDHAMEVANNTEYGLTGSVFTRNREYIERARTEFHVGNLYFNRKCTGAIVGVHPFGGFNMSGTDSKAGGPDYLLQFTQPKLSSEIL